MDRQQFLAQPDVSGFISWLRNNLDGLPVHLRLSPSRFVRGGVEEKVSGIEAVHALYQWKSSWLDNRSGRKVTSSDWVSTKGSLALLRERLLSGLAERCEESTYQACLDVLGWGGVRGAVAFLNDLRRQCRLVQYLEDCRPLFVLNGAQSLSQINSHSILRFDAGLTKIHALIDLTGSPIYDSRVGAAIAMLYALYRLEATSEAVLRFPTGTARGKQVRNPGLLGYQPAPQFFTPAVTPEYWAQYQVKLGWVIQETLITSSLFSGNLQERCHAFEAALFMIGYDLRCLESGEPAAPEVNDFALVRGRKRGSTWVPTNVPFLQVLEEYHCLSALAGCAVDLNWYCKWQEDTVGRTASTAKAYCAPLRPTELDLPSFTLDELEIILGGGAAGLRLLNGGRSEFISGDEREQVYLVSVFLTGQAMRIATEHAASPHDVLIAAGAAGNKGAAKILLRTGNQVGSHFQLLDKGGIPTSLFKMFFCDTLDDLRDKLFAVCRTL